MQTEKNLTFLERLNAIMKRYGISSINELAVKHLGYKASQKLNRLKDESNSPSAIRNKAVILRLKKDGRYWDKPEEDFVKKTSLSIEEIAKKLKKTKWAVYGKRRELMNKNPR